MACSLRERGEVLRWIHKGTGICWISEAPLRLDHEVLLANAILRQVECATVLGNRRVGATEETPTYFQGVPGAQAGDEQAVSSYGLHMGQLALPEDATQDGVTQEFVAACQTVRLGEWEPTQLENENVELEVDLKAEQFKVTPARLQKIFQQAMALLSKAETVASSQGWSSPTGTNVHMDISLFDWNKLLITKLATWGNWSDELCHMHFTQLLYPWELTVKVVVMSAGVHWQSKVVRLYCDNNHSVVAMLHFFTSPEEIRS
ncbi:hypothetical protein CYMTET_3327 [Cymbomonas tetramitiformis]|uniref:Uncharacterized protein n=1 Tax=Cymbomonas tetramitiformis TaxID=36881 RepID=A0AAE0H5C3_9CHLO|nr:hypothetical protein CYMTET_3327 [Cymbomonas tetramitiformis]